jgi:hypothetical protein
MTLQLTLTEYIYKLRVNGFEETRKMKFMEITRET